MSYDSESLRLAEHFLQDEPKAKPADAHKLAQVIQTAIEDWINYELGPCERCDGSGEIAVSVQSLAFVAAGPVPEDARGVAGAKCDHCGGSGRAADLRF